MNGIKSIFLFIKNQKGKILLFLISTILFVVALFPYDDLADVISQQVSLLSQNQLFLQFSKLKISLWPPGITMGDIHAESVFFAPIKVDEVTASPSVSSVWSKVPSGSLSASGLFRGNVEVHIKSGKKSEAGNEREQIEIKAEHLSLQDLREVGQLPLILKGQLDLQTTALADLTFTEQPDADITIKAEKFEIPSQTINTIMGPISIPDLRVSSVELKGRLNAGKLEIENGIIGKESDELHGSLKGNIALAIQNKAGFQPQIGAYSFDVDLHMKTALEDRLNLFLVTVSQFKTTAADNSHYRFRISAQNPAFPPNASALR